MFTLTEKDLARFWKKVDRGDPDECWIWTACIDTSGYGRFAFGKYPAKAHRLSWEIHKGSTKGLCVLHACDVPSCVNPNHLYLGTVQTNVRDQKKRGRTGPATKRGKLTGRTIQEIRQLHYQSLKEIAEQYGLRPVDVRKIANGECHKFR